MLARQTPSEDTGAQVPRPAGLPLDAGFTLIDAGPVAPEVAARIPEGRMVTVTQDMLGVREPTVMGLAGGATGLEASTLIYGLKPAGANAVGLVSFPR
jgi:hypothetical protein